MRWILFVNYMPIPINSLARIQLIAAEHFDVFLAFGVFFIYLMLIVSRLRSVNDFDEAGAANAAVSQPRTDK